VNGLPSLTTFHGLRGGWMLTFSFVVLSPRRALRWNPPPSSLGRTRTLSWSRTCWPTFPSTSARKTQTGILPWF